MAQKKFFHYLSPDFFNNNPEFFRLSDRENILLIPVFYNNRICDFVFPNFGVVHSVHGSYFDLLSDIRSRFYCAFSDIYRFKISDIDSFVLSGRFNIISPIDPYRITSGLFKYFIVVYLI